MGAALSSIGNLTAVAGDQARYGWQADNAPFAQHAFDDIFGRPAGPLIDYPENALDRHTASFFQLPACQFPGDGIEEGYQAGRVGGNHRIADTVKCCT